MTHTLCVDTMAGHSSRFYHSNTIFADTSAAFCVCCEKMDSTLVISSEWETGCEDKRSKSEVRQNRLAIGSSCDGSGVNDSGDLTATVQPQG